MQYTIMGFQQNVLCELKLDCKDAIILSWIYNFYGSDGFNMITLVDESNDYVWIYYNALLKELPILNFTKRALGKRFKKYDELEILKQKIVRGKHMTICKGIELNRQPGTYSYFKLNKKIMSRLKERPAEH